MIDSYKNNGYLVLKRFFTDAEIQEVRTVISSFHQSWVETNLKLYTEKAVNSAYLTSRKHLTDVERETLFRFIGSDKLMSVVTSIMGSHVAFMNTQLFFDPANREQKSYWHRDPQYHMSAEEQKKALQGPNVVHFRIPLTDEPGVELIPGTHKRWDSAEELDVRLEKNGRKNHNDLSSGVKVALNAGDLMVFDANMIHRGLYGMNRLSLDILFCDPVPELVRFVDKECLPDFDVVENLENAGAFERTVEIKVNEN